MYLIRKEPIAMAKERRDTLMQIAKLLRKQTAEEVELTKIVAAAMQMGYDICKMAGKETTT